MREKTYIICKQIINAFHSFKNLEQNLLYTDKMNAEFKTEFLNYFTLLNVCRQICNGFLHVCAAVFLSFIFKNI